jgi:outer membrane lipoprotein-sorting protein
LNLLVAAVLLLQDKTAEETFKKIEEQIEKAKTVRITSKLEGTLNQGKEKKISKTGVFILKQGNKVYAKIKEGDSTDMLVSDGAMMLTDFLPRKFPPGAPTSSVVLKTPEELNRTLSWALVSKGAVLSLLEMIGLAYSVDPKENKLRFPAHEFEHGGEDRGAKVLKYKLGDVAATLRYDPKSLRVFSRRLTHKDFGDVTETYDEFSLDADVSDDQFSVFPDNERNVQPAPRPRK